MTEVEKLREARSRTSVLMIQLYQLISRDQNIVVLIVEGRDDVGAYDVWFSKLGLRNSYNPIIANGKSQVLDFREQYRTKSKIRNETVAFAIDKDFDGTRGHEAGPDLFVTAGYSIENYFISDSIVESLAKDEFQLANDPDAIDILKKHFSESLAIFIDAFYPINLKLYTAKSKGVLSGSISSKLAKYVNIEIDGVDLEDHALSEIVPTSRTFTEAELNEGQLHFKELVPMHEMHRGKFLLHFLLNWLDCSASMLRSDSVPGIKVGAKKIKFSKANLTYRDLATRTTPPQGLDQIVALMDY